METTASSGGLPLVVMLDFLSEAALEQEVLAGVARVEAWNVQAESEIPWDKVSILLLIYLIKFA